MEAYASTQKFSNAQAFVNVSCSNSQISKLHVEGTSCEPKENQNIAAKLLSARLKKVLNILTTSLATRSCDARELVTKSGEIGQRTNGRY